MPLFEWDDAKNASNVEKHGVSFATAVRIFESPVFTFTDDRTDYGEIRELSVGHVEGVVFLTVVHTDRAGRRRIISARRANRRERQRYEQEIGARIEPR